jgi:hypothetical protein
MSLTKATFSMIEGAPANVLDYGADATGVADSTTAFNLAIATGLRVRVPAGTYKCNVTINNKTIIEGDGSVVSIVKPFNDAIAAMTYTFVAQQNPLYLFWDYHSEVRNIGFFGNSAMIGVGFTFGKTNPADYEADDEYANNVKFYGCLFNDLEKGVQFPFGNIGDEFYSCGFKNNKYGVYALNAKFGGLMHAGNKHFYAGEFSGNTCAVYIDNTVVGYGGVSFNETILESNQIAVYENNTSATFTATSFKEVWLENNGAMSSGSATVDIDLWTGATKTTQTIVKRTMIFDGTFGKHVFDNGFFTDIYVKGTGIQVNANNVRAESQSSNSGGVCTVDSDTSFIVIDSPLSTGAPPRSNNVILVGRPTSTTYTIDSNGTRASDRWFITKQRSAKVAAYGPSRAMSASLTTVATTGNGSFNLTGTVVSDGIIYSQCNEFTRAAFLSTEYTKLNSPNSSITTSVGWYVCTLDFKRTLGNPLIMIWDRSAAQFAISIEAPSLNKWYTFAAIGYSAGGQSLQLDFKGSNEDCTWRTSAYQILRFDTLEQAQSFLDSGVFAES